MEIQVRAWEKYGEVKRVHGIRPFYNLIVKIKNDKNKQEDNIL